MRVETEAVASYTLALHFSMTTSKKSICFKPLFFKPPTKNSFSNYCIFNFIPEHQFVLTQASGSQRHPFRETPFIGHKRQTVKSQFSPTCSDPKPCLLRLPTKSCSFLHGPSSCLSPFGKPKGFTSSQSSPHSMQLNSLFIYNIFATRTKLKGGRDCLWIAMR